MYQYLRGVKRGSEAVWGGKGGVGNRLTREQGVIYPFPETVAIDTVVPSWDLVAAEVEREVWGSW